MNTFQDFLKQLNRNPKTGFPLDCLEFRDKRINGKHRQIFKITDDDAKQLHDLVDKYIRSRIVSRSLYTESPVTKTKKIQAVIKSGVSCTLNYDIKRFYESVDHDVIVSILKKKNEPELADIVLSLLNAYKLATKSTRNVGIPTGLALSQILSELYLQELHIDCKELCKSLQKCYYFRYCDDILITIHGLSEKKTALIKHFIESRLTFLKLGFRFKESNQVKEIHFLGYKHRIHNPTLSLTYKTEKKIKDTCRLIFQISTRSMDRVKTVRQILVIYHQTINRTNRVLIGFNKAWSDISESKKLNAFGISPFIYPINDFKQIDELSTWLNNTSTHFWILTLKRIQDCISNSWLYPREVYDVIYESKELLSNKSLTNSEIKECINASYKNNQLYMFGHPVEPLKKWVFMYKKNPSKAQLNALLLNHEYITSKKYSDVLTSRVDSDFINELQKLGVENLHDKKVNRILSSKKSIIDRKHDLTSEYYEQFWDAVLSENKPGDEKKKSNYKEDEDYYDEYYSLHPFVQANDAYGVGPEDLDDDQLHGLGLDNYFF